MTSAINSFNRSDVLPKWFLGQSCFRANTPHSVLINLEDKIRETVEFEISIFFAICFCNKGSN